MSPFSAVSLLVLVTRTKSVSFRVEDVELAIDELLSLLERVNNEKYRWEPKAPKGEE